MISAQGLHRKLLKGGAILVAAAFLVLVFSRILRDRDVIAYWDMVGVEAFLRHSFLPRMNFITAFSFIDNQHRPVFPLYVFALDHLFFASRGLFPLALSMASLGGVCIISLRLLAPAIRGPSTRLAFQLLFPCVMFWPAHYENLLWPKQFHVTFSLLCTSAAFSLAAAIDSRESTKINRGDATRLALLSLFIFVSSFSFGWGLVGAFAVAGFVLWRRWPLARMLPVLAAVATTSAVYALAWRTIPDIGHSPGDLLPRIVNGIHYVLLFLAAPLWHLSHASIVPTDIGAIWVECLAGMALLAAAWPIAQRTFSRVLPPGLQPPATSYAQLVTLFALGCTLVTALGRMRLGPEQSLSSRYLFIPCLFWLVVPFLFPKLGGRVRWMPFAAMVASAFGLALTTPVFFDRMTDWAFGNRLGAIAAVLGEDGIPAPPRLLPDAEVLNAVMADYAEHGTSIYADPWPHWLGQAVTAANTAPCQGYLDSVEPVPESADRAAAGWLWEPMRESAPTWLAIVDRDGRVIGLATSGANRPDVANALHRPAAARAGFSGYIRGTRSDVAGIYGWFGGADWCRLSL